jgi:LysM repeat protein
MPDHRRRSPARFLAPLALIVVGVAIYAVITSTTDGGGGGGGETKSPQADRTDTEPKTTPTSPAKRKRRFYRVRAGDTLPAIEERTGVTQDDILLLNPDLDPANLQIGQRIRLRE